MNSTPPAYVLDTSAWFTLLEDEAGGDAVEEILERARANETIVFVSFIGLGYVGLPVACLFAEAGWTPHGLGRR